jgi:hypothetical protein
MFRCTSRACSAVAGVLLAAFCATPAAAGWLGFRNDLNRAVVVQASGNVLGAVHRCTPRYLYPGEVAWDWVPENSHREIMIYDGTPARAVLDRLDASVGKDDLFYVIQSAGKGEKSVQTIQVSNVGFKRGGKSKIASDAPATPQPSVPGLTKSSHHPNR